MSDFPATSAFRLDVPLLNGGLAMDTTTNIPRRATDCPVALCKGHSGQCELRTVSASQLGSIIVLVIALAALFVQLSSRINDPERQSLVQFYIVFAATALFYYMEECKLEEENFDRLRSLRWPSSSEKNWLPYAEFYMRVLILVVIGFAGAAPPLLMRYGFDSVDAGLSCLVVVYNLFLLWDTLVAIGGEVELVWRLFKLDLIGSVSTWLYLMAHHSWPDLGSIVIILLVVINVLQIKAIDLGAWFRRLTKRQLLR